MSQSYFPGSSRVASPSPMEASMGEEKHLKVDEGAYIEKKDRYVAEKAVVKGCLIVPQATQCYRCYQDHSAGSPRL